MKSVKNWGGGGVTDFFFGGGGGVSPQNGPAGNPGAY